MEEWDEDYARDEFIGSLYQDFANDVLAGKDELYGEVIDQFALERCQQSSETAEIWTVSQTCERSP